MVKVGRVWLSQNRRMANKLRAEILEHDLNVPRYTSYPTAPAFKAVGSQGPYTHELRSFDKDAELSLYLHIPFCKQLCWYCGCNTKISRKYEPIEEYMSLLLREIELMGRALAHRHTVTNIHFGGGSPGILKGCHFDRIMEQLRAHFEITKNTSIAIELDPRGVSEGRVAAYYKNGVNRVSLGVQDFSGEVLKAVNREQPFNTSYRAVQLLREYEINDINVDLMYGLPHQSLDTVDETFEKLAYLKADRVAYFGYAHVPWLKKHMRLIEEGALPKKDLRFDLFERGQAHLLEMGYHPVGIDHFCKENDTLYEAFKSKTLKRNFQGYTDDQADILLGFGVSAIGESGHAFFQNAPDMPSYRDKVLAGQLPNQKFYEKTKEDSMRAEIIEQLMCYQSVDLKEVAAHFAKHVSDFDGEMSEIRAFEKLGFLQIDGQYSITVFPDAKMMTRLICSVFDKNFAAKNNQENNQARHAKAI